MRVNRLSEDPQFDKRLHARGGRPSIFLGLSMQLLRWLDVLS